MKKIIIILLLITIKATSQITDTIVHETADSQINVYFVSQGFTATSMQQFRDFVTNYRNYMWTQAPFNNTAVQSRFRFIRVEAPSAVEHSPAAYFQFDHLGFDDPSDLDPYICGTTTDPDFLQYQSAECYTDFKDRIDAMILNNNLPGYNEKSYVIGVFNNNYYTGGGGEFAFVSLYNCNPLLIRQVLLHEFSHTFALLGDEYAASGSVPYEHDEECNIIYVDEVPQVITPYSFPLFHDRNVTNRTLAAEIPWKYLIDLSTPGIGTFAGAAYSDPTTPPYWYKPSASCRMRSVNEAFCAVCQNLITERVHEHLCYATNNVTEDFVFAHQYITHWRKASNLLTSTSDIGNTISVNYVSGNTITLSNGFFAAAGCDFKANIGDCNTIDLSNQYRVTGQKGTPGTEKHAHDSAIEMRDKIVMSAEPNPSSDFIRVAVNIDHINRVTLTAMDGKILFDKKVNSENSYKLDINYYPKGMYILTIETKGERISKKIIVE